ncbi:MAG TPA: restriction endonuclease subunit S [Terriglobales bacterium]|nr:restriction endonuclease subunit S [Terriglobales bacterium]
MNSLPNGWIEIDLGDHVYIAGRIGWRGLKAQEYKSSGPILLSVPNLNWGDYVDFSEVNHISQARYDESPEIHLKQGDILLVKDGAGIGKLGYVADLPGDATVNSSILVVRPNDDLLFSEYLFYYLKGPQFQKIARERITGSATPHLFQKDIKQLKIRVAPALEQRRIVSTLKVLLERARKCSDRLAKVPTALARFRQTVLEAAFSGRLTQHEAGSLSWRSQRIDSLFEVRTGGTPSRKQPRYFTGGRIPWVKTGEVQNGNIFETEEHITETALRDSNAKVFPAETILVAMYGEGKTRGQIARLKIPAATNQACAALINERIHEDTREYVFLFLLSQYQKLRRESFGGNQPNLNLGIIKGWEVPLPSLELQGEIVRRLRQLLGTYDRLEARLNRATTLVGSIIQSTLAKAFRGELVVPESERTEQEGRTFESALDLLERVRQEKKSVVKLREGARSVPTMKKRQSDKTMQKGPLSTAYLRETLVTAGHPLSPNDLWDFSGIEDIDQFYAQLKLEVDQGLVREKKESRTDRYLEPVS